MNRKTSKPALPLAVAVLAAATGCVDRQAPSDAVPMPAALNAANVQITNDAAILESRITREARPLQVLGGTDAGPIAGQLDASKPMSLTLVGTVQPPVVDGQLVMANDIDIHDYTATIAYNFAGDPFAGAVQVIDFQKPDRPVVVSEVVYRDADVNAVALLGSQLYVGLASDDPVLTTPALLEELKYTEGQGLEQTGRWLQMPSWAVTDLAIQGDDVAAAVGAQGGGVVMVRRSGTAMTIEGFAAGVDSRGVAWDGNSAVMSVCGAPGVLRRNGAPGLVNAGQTPVDGYSNNAAKGTIEVAQSRCYLGAGDGGFQVRNWDGALLATLRPTLTGNTDPASAVVNAVTVDKDRAFLAAGSAGVLVVNLGRYRSDEIAGSDGNLLLQGTLGLEVGASCNMIKCRNDILVVAAGTGGVKLISMK